jgi:hypothetical protein
MIEEDDDTQAFIYDWANFREGRAIEAAHGIKENT